MVMKCLKVCIGFVLQIFQVPDAFSDHSWNILFNYKHVFNK